MEKSCQHCHCKFILKRNPNQRYCSKIDCQRVRKCHWQQQKRAEDSDYRENQQLANQRWRARHPDYWKTYRANHPEYTKRNREQTQERWQQRYGKKVNASTTNVAKMDALNPKKPLAPGRYQLLPVGPTFAKMDAFLVEINVISEGYG